MAQQKKSSTSLQTTDFPKEFENVFNAPPKCQNQSHEKILNGEKDRRKIYDTNEVTLYSRIGQLRMIYEDIKEAYVGTATVFYDNPNSGRVYAVTCAHNLVHYDPTEDTVHSLKYC